MIATSVYSAGKPKARHTNQPISNEETGIIHPPYKKLIYIARTIRIFDIIRTTGELITNYRYTIT